MQAYLGDSKKGGLGCLDVRCHGAAGSSSGQVYLGDAEPFDDLHEIGKDLVVRGHHRLVTVAACAAGRS